VADLIVETVTASPPEGLAARPYSVAWRVRNLGPAATEGSWVDRLYLSQDASVGNDTLLGEVAYGGDELAAGSSYVLGLALNFPLVPGQYWLVVEAGVGSSLGETNDLNNRLVSASPLQRRPASAARTSS
jgi:hypothetical protein